MGSTLVRQCHYWFEVVHLVNLSSSYSRLITKSSYISLLHGDALDNVHLILNNFLKDVGYDIVLNTLRSYFDLAEHYYARSISCDWTQSTSAQKCLSDDKDHEMHRTQSSEPFFNRLVQIRVLARDLYEIPTTRMMNRWTTGNSFMVKLIHHLRTCLIERTMFEAFPTAWFLWVTVWESNTSLSIGLGC